MRQLGRARTTKSTATSRARRRSTARTTNPPHSRAYKLFELLFSDAFRGHLSARRAVCRREQPRARVSQGELEPSTQSTSPFLCPFFGAHVRQFQQKRARRRLLVRGAPGWDDALY